MKSLSISGGATKITGLYASCKTILESGYSPDIICGISSGAILSFFVANKSLGEIENLVLTFKQEDFQDPTLNVKFLGKEIINPKIFGRAISGKVSLLSQKPLLEILKKKISPFDFYSYKLDKKTPNIYILSYDFLNDERYVISAKESTYEDFINGVFASASLPVLTEPVIIKKNHLTRILFDGGVVDHNAGGWLLKNHNGITEHISIYSRPKDNKMTLDWKWGNWIQIFKRMLDIFLNNTSITDEKEEQLISKEKKIKLTQIFLPKVLKGMFDTDKERLKKLYDESVKETKKALEE